MGREHKESTPQSEGMVSSREPWRGLMFKAELKLDSENGRIELNGGGACL